ncbi:MogA/MoaB family molybdenum cofactor biosynthesis protein [Curtobacterium sp. MCJR17_055]|uniref:MogA/MoaB family molybdenum cofactor biosynthesis protein n=1 Tax=unclassified Curtobacterium TaxID=257496 RepID=UPI000D8658C7|nr:MULTISPECIES: molybdopterin-binding protein [unclassified Curtobacterium]PYY36805.1 MogA/MoaB family molybdenum cofactor biosynthesis protein [Curtobacterium sp. MCBD17_029]PYY37495.1 MogA/MoaB family molybdenum cofactor biosynthesis protein [Curtobacterium sp. MCPF17_046]PYY58084.1 MogA/MoaB family molybdenum cofactor biosynthesis protein [Curtobacterium sp. MCPF17_015]PYY58534.1 MogA/MoaB family molybdenum cofactor biosynthesis protein [Curtobacterium sp. MCJR17_055]PZE95158.1 MogA/MoaB f
MNDTAVPDRGRASVVVVSTSAATDPALDRTGPVIADWLRDRGFAVGDPVIVADRGPVADTLAAAVAGGARVVITTGGTGVTPTDRTPEAVAPLLDLELPGIVEEIRRRGLAGAGPTALLSRGVAGIVGGGTFVVTLPGSRGGVADGLAVLDGLLDHLLAQLHGDGHAPRSAS